MVSMNVGDIMVKDVYTIRPTETLEKALHKMVAFEVSGLPVLDSKGRLIGIVSRKEIELFLINKWREREVHADLDGAAQTLVAVFDHAAPYRVREIMDRNPPTLDPETSMGEAARLMAETGVTRYPITRRKQLLGIITQRDLLLSMTLESKLLA